MKDHAKRGLALIATLVAVGPAFTCEEQGSTGGGAWPHEPFGLPLISDYEFSDPIPVGMGLPVGSTWFINNPSLAARVADLSAPTSPPFVAQVTYPVGFADGSAPANIYIDPPPIREAYFAFVWKASDPFESHPSNVNKIAFMFPGGQNGDIFLMMYRTSGGYEICTEPEFAGDARQLCPNVTATPIALGRWHKIEWYVRYNSAPGARDGISRWWVDGVLNGNFHDIQLAGDNFVELQFSPTYGGNTGAIKTQTDHFWFDHVHLSGR